MKGIDTMKQGVLCRHCQPYADTNNIYCQLKKETVPGYKCDKHHCKDHEFSKTAMVVVGVGRCDECPCVKQTRTPRAGYAFDYYCNAVQTPSGPMRITTYVEYDSEIPPVPDWCPFKIKEEDFDEDLDG